MVIGDPDPNVQYDPLQIPSEKRLAVRQYTIEASGEAGSRMTIFKRGNRSQTPPKMKRPMLTIVS